MRHWSVFALIVLSVLAFVGCGRDVAGTYDAGVLRAEPRSIVLKADGRYEMRNAEFVEMGGWRVEGDTLFLRGDISNGVHIQPALQEDRTFRLNAIDQIIDDGSYGHYNLELVYERE
jgi:hypothetical protein